MSAFEMKRTSGAFNDVVARTAISEDGQKFLAGVTAHGQFVALLVEKKLLVDALNFLAQALTRPDAVGWSVRCVRDALKSPSPPVAQALDAAARWKADPSEANRRAAHAASQSVPSDSPAGFTCLAAFFSGGSIAPANVSAVVPPADNLTGCMAAGAVMLAAVAGKPDEAPKRQAQYVAWAVEASNAASSAPAASAARNVAPPSQAVPSLRSTSPIRTLPTSGSPPRLAAPPGRIQSPK